MALACRRGTRRRWSSFCPRWARSAQSQRPSRPPDSRDSVLAGGVLAESADFALPKPLGRFDIAGALVEDERRHWSPFAKCPSEYVRIRPLLLGQHFPKTEWGEGEGEGEKERRREGERERQREGAKQKRRQGERESGLEEEQGREERDIGGPRERDQ